MDTRTLRNAGLEPVPIEIAGPGAAAIPAYLWSTPVAGETLVVLVHGFGDHGRAMPYRMLAEFLSARGVAALSYDQRGHGDAARRRRGATAWNPLVDDLHAVVAGVRSRCEPGSLVVAGLSMGALVALDASLAPQAPIDAVVAAAAPLGAVRASRLALATARTIGRWIPRLPIAPRLDLASIAADAGAVAAYVGDPSFHQTLRAGFALEMLDAIARIRAQSHAIRRPTLFLHGTADRIAPWDPALADGVGAGIAEVRLFDGLRHNLFLELDRAAVFTAIVAWLERLQACHAHRVA